MEHIVEDWYSMEDKHVIGYLKKLVEQQDNIIEHLGIISNKIDVLETKVNSFTEEREKDTLDTKRVTQALHELKIIKEREINVLLREHIPFPFQHPSPSFRSAFIPPFSSKNKKPTL